MTCFKYRTKSGKKQRVSGLLTDIKPDSLFVENDTFLLKDIVSIYYNRKGRKALQVIGVAGFITYITLNFIGIQSFALAGTEFALFGSSYLIRSNFKIGKKFNLLIK